MKNGKDRAVLITGADGQTGYATARSLASLDVQLVGLCSKPGSRFCQSRLWDQVVTVDSSMEAHLERLIALGRSSSHKRVLFPTQDNVVQLISDHRDELKGYYEFVLPERPVVDLLMDKTAFHQWAVEHGFPVPESHIAESKGELDQILRNITFPVTIKPLYRTEAWVQRSGIHKVFKLNRREEIRNIDFDLSEAAPRLLVQRWIPGGDGDVHFCLMYVDRNGRKADWYTGRKLLQWPTLTGSTAICVGTSNREVRRLAEDVLLTAGFRGLGSLEVKKSDQDDGYYITEPTVGRNDYQSYLAVAGGVNLTQIAFYDAIGDPRQVTLRRKKATWIDEDYMIRSMKRSGFHIRLHGSKVLRHFGQRVSFSHFNLRDIVPFLLLLSNWFPRPVRRVVRKVARSSPTGIARS